MRIWLTDISYLRSTLDIEQKSSRTEHAPYPLYLCVEGKPVVVVGGGRVAERKVHTLLGHGAAVTVVAPEITAGLRDLVAAGRVDWADRAFQEGDVSVAMLVFAATGDRDVDGAVSAEAQRRGILVNAADMPDLCTALVPSVLRRGRLQIAVSTQGASPALARDIRRSLEAEFPDWWEPYLDLLAEVRLLIKARVPGPASVRVPLYAVVAGDEVRQRVATGERPTAEQVYAQVVGPLLADMPSTAEKDGSEDAEVGSEGGV